MDGATARPLCATSWVTAREALRMAPQVPAPPRAISCFRLQAWMTRYDTGRNEVRAGYWTRTVHDTVHDKPAPFPLPCPILPIPHLPSEAGTVRHTSPPLSSAPSPSLRARTVHSNEQSLPCPSRPSPPLLRFSGLL